MKKSLIVLVMAGALALTACGSKETSETTAVETPVVETTASEVATSTDADINAALEQLAEMDIEEILALSGIELEKVGDSVILTYPAAMFAGLDKEMIETSLAQQGEGKVTVNEDGSVNFELTAEEFDSMAEMMKNAMPPQ